MFLSLAVACNQPAGDTKVSPETVKLRAEVNELRAELAQQGRRLEGKAETPWKIVNFHDHVYKMEHAERYHAAATKAGIVRTVLVASPKYTIFGKHKDPAVTEGWKRTGFDANFQDVLSVAKRWPDHFIPFSSVDAGSEGALDMIKRHHEQGAKGLKLYNGHSHFHVKSDGLVPGTLEPVLQYCSEKGLPILWHVRISSYLKEFEQVLQRYPKLKIVVAHYGVAFWRPKGKQLDTVARLLKTYPQLYFDTSLGTRKILVDGMALMGRYRQRFIDLINAYPDRFVIGTDMVITGNPEKTTAWMSKVIWGVRDQHERDGFTLDLAARWSKYHPSKGADANGKMRGLALSPDVLKKVYETTPATILGF